MLLGISISSISSRGELFSVIEAAVDEVVCSSCNPVGVEVRCNPSISPLVDMEEGEVDNMDAASISLAVDSIGRL